MEDFFGYLSDLDKQRISSLNFKASFRYNYNNHHFIYLIGSPQEMKLYKNVLSINLIPYFCEDISQSVIDNKINLEQDFIKYCDETNYQDYDNFIFEMNIWILNNLNLDSILDRINIHGIKTLRPIDTEFLKNF